MKTLITIWLIMIGNLLYAQQESQSFTYGEFKGGYGITFFGEGLSERYEQGNFSTSGGGIASVGAYHKFAKLSFMNFGLKFKSLGAAPSQGDNGEEMFFNFWSSAVSAKYFPFNPQAKSGLFIQGDYSFVSQFTQKYRQTDAKVFDHQFAIGSGFSGTLGYDLDYKNVGLILSVEYEHSRRQGEVTGIGDKTFVNSNLFVCLGLRF